MASVFTNAAGETLTREEVVKSLIGYCYLYQELMLIDGDPSADEAIAAMTCVGEWADCWGAKTDVWREAWDRASMYRNSQRKSCAFVREFAEGMAEYLTEKNRVALLQDLILICGADSEVHQEEALLCNEIAEYLGLEAPFLLRFSR